jgi:hypothetical protein
MNPQVSEYISRAQPEQRAIMETIRQLLHESVDGLVEEFKWSRPVFRKNKDLAYLKTAKAHITLGFFNSEKISEGSHLLEGSGNGMRHIKLKSVEDINKKLLQQWFRSISE